jgi:hypothetical protein
MAPPRSLVSYFYLGGYSSCDEVGQNCQNLCDGPCLPHLDWCDWSEYDQWYGWCDCQCHPCWSNPNLCSSDPACSS